MKPSIHLIYGIIIGILLMACSGSDNTTSNTASNQENIASTTNTATPTSSHASQKQFKEVTFARIAYYHHTNDSQKWKLGLGDTGFDYFKKGFAFPSRSNALQKLKDEGYSIISWKNELNMEISTVNGSVKCDDEFIVGK
tara:strand:+ start:126 stop:545 length:420 start_codon:yes stop_codon:yes gene_type:complete